MFPLQPTDGEEAMNHDIESTNFMRNSMDLIFLHTRKNVVIIGVILILNKLTNTVLGREKTNVSYIALGITRSMSLSLVTHMPFLKCNIFFCKYFMNI